MDLVRQAVWRYGTGVIVLHVFGMLFLVISVPHHPSLLGLGVLAYTFGLRHAFDCDHIIAIDNTVRKLRQERQTTIGVGFFFSLGHASVVCVMTVLTAVAMAWAQRSIPALQHIGGIVGSIVSGTFLVLIGIVNFSTLINLYQLLSDWISVWVRF